MSRGSFSAVLLALVLAAPAGAASEAPYYFALAQAYAQEGSYGEAVEAFEKAVELEPREPYIRMEFAELLLRLGRIERAAEHAGAARRLAPSDADAVRLYAFVQRRLADTSPEAMGLALQAFVQLHEMAPEDAEAAMMLAQLYLGTGRPEEAVVVLEETLELRPRSRMLVSLLAETLDRQGRADRAESVLDEFLTGNPRFLRGRRNLADLLGRRGEHRRAAELLEATPGEDRWLPEIRRDLALARYRSGDLQRALIETEAWLEEEPDAVPAHLLRANLLSARGEDEAARDSREKLLAREPTHFRAVSLLSEILERQDRADEAAGLLRRTSDRLIENDQPGAAAQLLLRLIDLRSRAGAWPEVVGLTEEVAPLLDPAMAAEVSMVRAQALAEDGRHPEALAVLDALRGEERVGSRATAAYAELSYRNGDHGAARASLGQLGESSEIGDLLLAAQTFQRLELYSESIPVLRRADAMSTGSTDVLFLLGAAYERVGRHAAAEREFRRLLAARPDFAPALNYLGYMWAERGVNLPEALELVRKAVDLDPDNGAYVDSLGWAYYQLGRYEDARGHLERAATLVNDDSIVLEHLGDLYRAVGELELARLNYQRALDLAGENVEEVRRKLRDLDGAL